MRINVALLAAAAGAGVVTGALHTTDTVLPSTCIPCTGFIMHLVVHSGGARPQNLALN